jgi:uncharacterized protein (TIRG00374 family)
MLFKKFLNTALKVFLPLGLGAWLLWVVYRNHDFEQTKDALRNVRYEMLAFSLLFGLTANVVRAWRWSLLIRTLGERFRMRNLVFAVLGNYALNFVLPRLGEVWRCGIVTKYEKISFSKLLGTLLVDRVFDSFAVGLLSLFILVFNFGFFSSFFARHPVMLPGPSWALWFVAFLLGCGLLLWYLFTRLEHLFLVKKVKEMLSNVWEGMKSFWLMERKGLFLVQTVLIWVCYFLYFYVTFFAFDFTRDLGIRVGLIAFIMGSIGVGIPVQGGIGVWNIIVATTLVVCSGISEQHAGDFALVVFTVQSLWLALCGLFGIFALPLANRKKQS